MSGRVSKSGALTVVVSVLLVSLSCQRVRMIDLTGGTQLTIELDETSPSMALLGESDRRERLAAALRTYFNRWSDGQIIETRGNAVEVSIFSTDRRLSRVFSKEDLLHFVIVPGIPPLDDTCRYARDGMCDLPPLCYPGTDMTDCSGAPAYVEEVDDGCRFAFDGVCDEPINCGYGTDSTDCKRTVNRVAIDPPAPPLEEINIPFSRIQRVRISGEGDLVLVVDDREREDLDALLQVGGEPTLQIHQEGTVLATSPLRSYYKYGSLLLPAGDQDLLPLVGEVIRVETLKRDGALRLVETVTIDPPSAGPGGSKYPW